MPVIILVTSPAEWQCSRESLKEYLGLLNPDDDVRKRIEEFYLDNFEDAADSPKAWFVARILFLHQLSKERNILPISNIVLKRTAYGRCITEDFGSQHYSISHTNNLVGCAVGPHNLGVDIVTIEKHPIEVYRQCFTPTEWKTIVNSQATTTIFSIYWSLKESVLKALGLGMAAPFMAMRDLNFGVLHANELSTYTSDVELLTLTPLPIHLEVKGQKANYWKFAASIFTTGSQQQLVLSVAVNEPLTTASKECPVNVRVLRNSGISTDLSFLLI